MVVASNHQSYLDPVLVGVALSRSMNYMARSSLFRFAPFGWLIRSVNAFPVHREGIDTKAMREAIRRVSAGGGVIIFPEGTRTRDGRLGRIRKGAGLVSRRAKAALVPALVDGAFEAWPRHRVVPRMCSIRVAFGDAIPYAEQKAMSEEDIAERLTTAMMELERFLTTTQTSCARQSGA